MTCGLDFEFGTESDTESETTRDNNTKSLITGEEQISDETFVDLILSFAVNLPRSLEQRGTTRPRIGGCDKLPKSKFQILTTNTLLYGQK